MSTLENPRDVDSPKKQTVKSRVDDLPAMKSGSGSARVEQFERSSSFAATLDNDRPTSKRALFAYRLLALIVSSKPENKFDESRDHDAACYVPTATRMLKDCRPVCF